MASRELYSSIGKPKKVVKRNNSVGNTLLDPLRLLGDNALSVFGASDVIEDEDYATNLGSKISDIASPIMKIGGMAAATALGGPAAGMALGSVQKGISSATDKQPPTQYEQIMNSISGAVTSMAGSSGLPKLGGEQTGPSSFSKGGLRTFEGNTHEEGGIPLGQDEVENSETMMPMDSQSDFIFSDRLYPIKSISSKGKPTFGKQSFAQLSKKINKPLEIRPNDAYSKRTIDRKLGKLAQEQEALKSVTPMKAEANHMAMGGRRYADGGEWDVFEENDKDIRALLSGNTLISPMTPKGMPTRDVSLVGPENFDYSTLVGDTESTVGNYKSNFLPTAIGYGVQALTNLPALLAKPETKNFSRVKFDDISLAEQRNEARRSRNLGLATARSIGAQSGDIGQTMNYLSGTTAAMNSQYGNLFNQSLMQEKQYNSELGMKEQLANSEIERYEEGINTAEADAIRNLRMQALSNVGTSAAMAGKDYMVGKQTDAQLAALVAANPDYGLDWLTPIRKKAYGGKRRRTK